MQESNLNSLKSYEENSLLDDNSTESLLDQLTEDYTGESLLDGEGISPETTPAEQQLDPEEEKRRRRAYFLNPEVQAEIVLDNYLRNRGFVVSGREKRTLRREFLREAKKGRYRKLFLDMITDAEKEETQEKENVEKGGSELVQ